MNTKYILLLPVVIFFSLLFVSCEEELDLGRRDNLAWAE